MCYEPALSFQCNVGIPDVAGTLWCAATGLPSAWLGASKKQGQCDGLLSQSCPIAGLQPHQL